MLYPSVHCTSMWLRQDIMTVSTSGCILFWSSNSLRWCSIFPFLPCVGTDEICMSWGGLLLRWWHNTLCATTGWCWGTDAEKRFMSRGSPWSIHTKQCKCGVPRFWIPTSKSRSWHSSFWDALHRQTGDQSIFRDPHRTSKQTQTAAKNADGFSKRVLRWWQAMSLKARCISPRLMQVPFAGTHGEKEIGIAQTLDSVYEQSM